MRGIRFLESMPSERRVLIGRIMWAVAFGTAGGSVALAAVNDWPLGLDPWGVQTLGAFVVGSLGLLVITQRPTNVIGWLMLWMAVFDGLSAFGLQYGVLSLQRPDSLPLPDVIGTVPYGAGIGAVFGMTITFFLLLFPDGQLPSPRWRPVAWAGAAGILLMVAGLTLHAWQSSFAGLLAELERGGLRAEGLAAILNQAGHVLVFLVFPLAVASLFVRRRRAGATERQQLKLFAYGAVVFLSSVFLPLPEPYWLIYEISATLFLFVAVAVAIIRYRLYDIDRLVSRTVSYVTVTALLVGLYLGSVFLLQTLLPAQGDLAIAASTLAAAAAFNPVRRRVQAFVDHRFNRSRYDAARTVEHFSRRLRGAHDAGRLGEALSGTAASVMQPTQVSLWLRESEP
ncbi:MAG TPA: hypothetical protein VHL52_06915 [Acidimicrobiia bacterium]|nr:hypothetical protein [Acidimicrobiia bacterium]